MAISPVRLYRTWTWAVILVGTLGAVSSLRAQFARAPSVSKGPRALGLLELLPSGKAHLIPICIMVDGKFYDASIYKATPVPMAVEADTVYEAERTGVPAGLFTVTNAAQTGASWLGNGSWMEAGAQPPSTGMKAESKPREEEEDKPPVLRRPGSEKPAENKPAGAQGGTEAKSASSPTKTPEAGTSATSGQKQNSESASPETEESERPRLRRGVPEERPSTPKQVTPRAEPPEHASSTRSGASKGRLQQLAAISDAGGPDPRPYTYEMKPREEREFRQKMLSLARTEMLKQPALAVSQPPSQKNTKMPAKQAPPQFENVNFTVFDIASNNEPILVWSAAENEPVPSGKPSESAALNRYVLLVARSDLYGELRTIFFGVTDGQHLDLAPRMQLIDAVDADGDGRAELLFRQISDAGSAYAVYRVTADRLVPLFEGTPGSH